ncbi:MAG TPA: TrmH family RNA methyltransferase [Actinomycetota bacterium]
MITSTKNPRIVAAAKLKKRAFRDREARFLVEGAQVTREAIDAGRVEVLFHTTDEHGRVDALVDRARESGVRTEAVTQQVVEHLTSTVTPQGIVGVATYVDVPLGELQPDPSLVAVLSSVRDPGNAGTILRTADAAGADGVVFGRESVDVYNPKTVRASAGSLFHLPVARDVDVAEALEALRRGGLQVLATAADGERTIYEADLSPPTALVFGNEAHGLEPEIRAMADATIRVPIRGRAESLNLAASAAVTLFEAVRAREAPGGLAEIAGLIGPAGHDLRSPLTALTGFVTTLGRRWDGFSDEERREIVEGMALDGHRTGALVRLVVDAVRILSGAPLTSTSDRADVGAAARWLADLFAASEDFPDVEVEGEARARSDPDRIRALLFGLVDGAVWWGSEGPVSLRVAEEGSYAVVEAWRAGNRQDEEPTEVLGSPEHGGRVSLYAVRLVAERLGGSLGAETDGGIRLLLRLPA